MISAILWICAAIAIAVFAVMLYSVATFRTIAQGSARKHATTVELVWTLIPIVIFVAAVLPSLKTLEAFN